MSKKPFALEISVGRPDGPRCRIWKTWGTQKGEACIMGLGYGNSEKITIHKPKPPEHPTWRAHIRSVSVAKLGVPEIREGTNSVKRDELKPVASHWPGDWLDNETLVAMTLVIPSSELLPHPPTDYTKRNITWLDPPEHGLSVEVAWAIGRTKPPTIYPTATHTNLSVLAKHAFPDGTHIHLVAANVQRPEHEERLARARQRINNLFLQTPEATRSRYIGGRAFIGSVDVHGLGTTWDLAIT